MIRLASDTVFVPTVDRLVALDGEVKRLAIYEVLGEETLGDLLQWRVDSLRQDMQISIGSAS